MKAETAMAAALKAAGYEAWAELYQFTANFLRDAKGNRTKATDELFNAVREDKALLRELCAHYVDKIADDMKGLPGEGQSAGAEHSQPPVADARQQNGSEAGHRNVASGQTTDARPLPADRDGKGQPPIAKGQHPYASPARELSKADRAAMKDVAKAASVTVLSVFDRYKVRDGRALSKVTWHELSKFTVFNEFEARAFRYIKAEAESRYANIDPHALVKDVVSAEIVEKAFAFAKVAGNDR